jgi:hypothetical protein
MLIVFMVVIITIIIIIIILNHLMLVYFSVVIFHFDIRALFFNFAYKYVLNGLQKRFLLLLNCKVIKSKNHIRVLH